MKEWPFQQRGQLPITLNVRILKLWNLAVCSVHSALHPNYDTVSLWEGMEGRGNQSILSTPTLPSPLPTGRQASKGKAIYGGNFKYLLLDFLNLFQVHVSNNPFDIFIGIDLF